MRWRQRYLFHLANNHPFVDGNKRTGLMAALVFLDMNGVAVDRDVPELYSLTMSVAQGKLDKATLATELRRLFPPSDS